MLLGNDKTLSTGSRAICSTQRRRNVSVQQWDTGHERPVFNDRQQHRVERSVADCGAELSLVGLRWNNKVGGLAQRTGFARPKIGTPHNLNKAKREPGSPLTKPKEVSRFDPAGSTKAEGTECTSWNSSQCRMSANPTTYTKH